MMFVCLMRDYTRYAFGAHLDERYSLSLGELHASTNKWGVLPETTARSTPEQASGYGTDTTTTPANGSHRSPPPPTKPKRYFVYDVAEGAGSVRELTTERPLAFEAGMDYGTSTLYAVAGDRCVCRWCGLGAPTCIILTLWPVFDVSPVGAV
jgi:hypothetical protein